MSDPLQKKPCKNRGDESQPGKKQQTLIKGLTSTATSYILQFVTYVKGLLPNKQVLGDDLKELISKTEGKLKEVCDKILEQFKVFQDNELPSYKHYSKEELAKVETKFKAYSARMKDILGEVIKHLQAFKNGLQTKIMTHEEVQSLITYFEEKIDQTKKLTQEMIKNIQETIKDPQLKKKLVAIVENNYKKVKGSMDALYTAAIKDTNAAGEHKCLKSESTDGKSFKSTTMSHIGRIITYVRGFMPGKSSQTKTPMSEDLKSLLVVTEVRIKELYDGILNKVKDLHDNELQIYKNYSKEELAKVKSSLNDYSATVRKLSDDMLERLKILKKQLQTRIITHEDFQSLVSYFKGKIVETKRLTEDMIKNIQATVNEPTLGKKLEAMVENNSQKMKILLDDLYTAIKKNVGKVGQLQSLPNKKTLFSKMPTFGKTKASIDGSSAPPLSSNANEAAATNLKGNAAVSLNKEKVSFFNLSKHFNSRTIYGRSNVAKATYAGVLIYYIYRKVKNTTT